MINLLYDVDTGSAWAPYLGVGLGAVRYKASGLQPTTGTTLNDSDTVFAYQAIGGLGYAACAQELQQQCFDQGVSFDRVVVGSGSSGTHGGLLAGFLGNHIQVPIVGVGVSRDPADQEPLVHREAQAVLDLVGIPMTVPREAVVSVGGYWQPKYSIPNDKMVEAALRGVVRE